MINCGISDLFHFFFLNDAQSNKSIIIIFIITTQNHLFHNTFSFSKTDLASVI